MAEILASGLRESIHIQSQELSYERAQHNCALTHKDETSRKLRVILHSLEEEIGDLRSQLLEDEGQIAELEILSENTHDQVLTLEAELKAVRTELITKSKEVEHLKAKLNNLRNCSMELTKLLTENLALTRTIATMGPEIEHLRAEAASHQKLLSEKLSSQRMLNAAQVDLETEKRAAQRLQAREDVRKARDDQEESQLQTLQAELAEERRERQKVERKLQKAESDLDDKKAVFELRLNGLKSKLKAAKDEVKETQNELQKSRNHVKASIKTNDVTISKARVQNSRKRSVAQADESKIGTPGIQPVKRNKRASSVVGDKSLFSMTPFLNKTAIPVSASPQSPTADRNTKHDTLASVQEAISEPQIDESTAQSQMPISSKEAGLTETLNNLPIPKAKRNATRVTAERAKKVVPVLEQVQENEEEENTVVERTKQSRAKQGNQAKQPLQEVSNPSVPGPKDSLFAKKKQKILGRGLGKTLFDDDVDPGLGESQSFAKARHLGKKPFLFGTGIGSAEAGGFSFSPLKKDRQWLGQVWGHKG